MVGAIASVCARIPLGAEHAATVQMVGRTMVPRPAKVCVKCWADKYVFHLSLPMGFLYFSPADRTPLIFRCERVSDKSRRM